MAFKMKGFPKIETSALKHAGHGLGNHGKHGSAAERQEAVNRWNEGDPASQKPNAKKLAKKTAKAEEKKSKADAKMAAHDRLVQARSESGKSWKEISGKERRAEKKTGRQAARAAKRSDVAESVRKYEAQKVGDYMEKPKKVMKAGKGLEVTLPGRTNVEREHRKHGKNPKKGQTWAGNAGKRKSGKKKGSIEVVDKERVDIKATQKQRKKYRQNKGLRGAINARRTGKGKDKI